MKDLIIVAITSSGVIGGFLVGWAAGYKNGHKDGYRWNRNVRAGLANAGK